jgi:hypothetical protein
VTYRLFGAGSFGRERCGGRFTGHLHGRRSSRRHIDCCNQEYTTGLIGDIRKEVYRQAVDVLYHDGLKKEG